MSKIELSNLPSGHATTAALNARLDQIENEFNDKVLYRDNPDGEPNAMENVLDMADNQIINLPDAIDDQDAVPLGQLLDIVEQEVSDQLAEQMLLVGTGNVVGPLSSVNDQVALFSGITGKLIKTGQTMAQYLNDFLLTLYNIFPVNVSNVTDLASLTAVAGRYYKLKEYNSGTGKGGGDLVGVVGVITPNNVETFTGTSGTYFKRINYGAVKASMTGAFLDGTTNDTVAAQRAIDFCLPQPASIPAKKLIVDGPCLITSSSLFIDRFVDTCVNWFEIEGEGSASGFKQNSNFVMFDSRLPYGPAAGLYTKTPCTEFTVFKNLTFENTIGGATGFVFNEKYLRLGFEHCRFRGIRGCLGTDYFQSIKFVGCHFRGNNGVFLKNRDGYDIRVIAACEFESAGAGFEFTDRVWGSSFSDSLVQNSSTPWLLINQAAGVVADDNYFEANTGLSPYIRFGQLGGTTDGCSVSGNAFLLNGSQEVDVNYYPVVSGPAKHLGVYNNYSSGNICDNSTSVPMGVVGNGNATPINRMPFKQSPYSSTNIVPAPAGTQAAATPLFSRVNVIPVNATVNASVILPQSLSIQEVDQIIVLNNGSSAIRVYPFVGERVLGLAYNAPITLSTGSRAIFGNGMGDNWVQLV